MDLDVFICHVRPQTAANFSFREELEPPPGDSVVVSVSSVGVVEVEDRFDGLGRFGVLLLDTDVDALIGVGGDEFETGTSKGRITDSMYSSSALSDTSDAKPKSSSR